MVVSDISAKPSEPANIIIPHSTDSSLELAGYLLFSCRFWRSPLDFIRSVQSHLPQERSLWYQSALRRLAVRQFGKTSRQGTSGQQRPMVGLEREKRPTRLNNIVDIELAAAKVAQSQTTADVHLSLMDVNPFLPLWKILKRKNNLAILLPSDMFEPTMDIAILISPQVFFSPSLIQ